MKWFWPAAAEAAELPGLRGCAASPQQRTSQWVPFVILAIFLVHASCYLYFFVDDEGITLVYARNLLRGFGLTYAVSEGPAEGYSNFLHVLVMAALLRATQLFGLSAAAAFVVGGLWSLACGAGLVWLTWRTTRRLGLPRAACATAALVLALSGPLAVWSNSSLETVPFAFAFMALVASTLAEVHPRAATFAAAAVLLIRIDGILYVCAWLLARLAFGETPGRRVLLRRVLLPTLAVAAVYALARGWYFGSWLPLPLQTKIAHKLFADAATVVWTTRHEYLPAFAYRTGLPLLLGLLTVATTAGSFPHRRTVLALWSAVIVLLAYVSLVGDWMFGFRFFVPLLAPLTVLGAFGLAALEQRRRWLPRLVAAGVVFAACVSAARVMAFYEADQQRPVFWKAPSLDPAIRFGEYYDAYLALAPLVQQGGKIAYHEAGFVPYLLDVENIDMLGLVSKFPAASPGLDAIFTDVGRYYPLTPEPPHHAVHAYLIRAEPSLMVVRKSWVRSANGGGVPATILNGYYELAQQTRAFVIYKRSQRPINAARVRADGFLENFAHPAYARRLTIDGRLIEPASALEAMPSLSHGGSTRVELDPSWTLHVDLARPSPVYEVLLEGEPPQRPIRVELQLLSQHGRLLGRLERTVKAGERLYVRDALRTEADVRTIDLRVASIDERPLGLQLHRIRIMGQTTGLRDHVAAQGIR